MAGKIQLGGKLNAVLEMNDDLREYLKPADRKRLYNLLGRRVGNSWRWDFLDRRLTKRVLAPPFNYRLDTSSPMVATGHMARYAIWRGKINVNTSNVRASVRTVGGTNKGSEGPDRIRIDVPLPYGHGVPKEIAKVFRIGALPDELQVVADRFAAMLVKEREQLVMTTNRRGRKQINFSAAQRRRMQRSWKRAKVRPAKGGG